MIEKHYGRYVRNDAIEQLSKLVAVTPNRDPRGKAAGGRGSSGWKIRGEKLVEAVQQCKELLLSSSFTLE